MKMDPFKNGNETDRATETWLFKCTIMRVYIRINSMKITESIRLP